MHFVLLRAIERVDLGDACLDGDVVVGEVVQLDRTPEAHGRCTQRSLQSVRAGCVIAAEPGGAAGAGGVDVAAAVLGRGVDAGGRARLQPRRLRIHGHPHLAVEAVQERRPPPEHGRPGGLRGWAAGRR